MANVFKDAAQSFYSGMFYGELARARKGVGLPLIFLLTLLFSALMCTDFLLDTQLRDVIHQMPRLSATLPAVMFKDGKLSIDKPVPYRVSLSQEPGSAVLVIDPAYKLGDNTAQYMHDNNMFALVTSDKAIWAKNQWKELQIYDLAQTAPFTITHEQWVRVGDSIDQWGVASLAAAFFISFSIAMLILNLLATVLTAVVIMALDVAAKANIEFAGAMRLAAAARIPINLLPIVPVLFGVPALASASGWVLWGLYLLFAVWAVRLHSAVKAG